MGEVALNEVVRRTKVVLDADGDGLISFEDFAKVRVTRCLLAIGGVLALPLDLPCALFSHAPLCRGHHLRCP